MTNKRCNNCGHSFWQQIFEAGIPAVCPQCNLIYSVAKGVSNSPKVPQEIKGLAGVVVVGLLFFGALHVMDKALKG